jgi:hypothetical protein
MKFNKHILIILGMVGLALSISCKKSHTEKQETVDLGPAPDKTWKEHWFEHKSDLTLAYYNQEITVYKDDAVGADITWPYQLMTDVWKYTKKTYGTMGEDPRLYVVLHGGAYGTMGRFLPYFDEEGDFRNVVDLSTDNYNYKLFAEPALIHETGHVVESATNGVKGSPAFNIWGDSKWNDMFIYDVYLGLGMKDQAVAWHNSYMAERTPYPRAGTYWFRDWWMPIYTKYGQSAVLSKYFVVLSKNFPKVPHVKGFEFNGSLNMGEFVHFWSGAAGVSLKAQAILAFGWTDEWDAQFKQAQIDYPNVTYTK